MDRFDVDLDRQLGAWLREEGATRASAGLVEAVFARTSRTRQVRRWWPPVSPLRRRRARPHLVGAEKARSWSGSSLAGAVAIVLVVTVVALTLRSISPGPGTHGGPSTSPSPSPSPELTATPSPVPTVLVPLPSPRPTSLDGTAAQVLDLGSDAGPIDVVEAFGSMWTANIHSNDASRLDPTTLEQVARIPAGTGPAWFAVTDIGVWVTNQLGSGLVLIDPVSNTVVTAIGDAQPCGAPVQAVESLWVSACDSGVILRVDLAGVADVVAARRFPSRSELISEIAAPGYRWLAVADGRLFTGNAAGLAEIDPTTETVTDLGFCCGDVMGSDGRTIWLHRVADVVRMDPADGSIVATFPYPGAGSVTFVDGRAWLTVSDGGVVEIDLASNDVLRTIRVPGSTLVAREVAGALWVTSFDTSELWRIEP